MTGIGFLSASEKKNIFDPRTKLALMIMISLIMITGDLQGYHYWIRVVLEVIVVILLWSNRKYKASIVSLILFSFAAICEGALIHVATTGAFNIILFFLSGVISRMGIAAMMGYYVMTSTTVSEFVAAMERMHASQKIIVPFSVMFRFFPTIVEEYQSINMAMKMRGITMRSSGGLLSLIEYRMIPVMMSTVRIGNELSAAALTKGLGNKNKRTNICKIGFGVMDIIGWIFVIGTVIFYHMT